MRQAKMHFPIVALVATSLAIFTLQSATTIIDPALVPPFGIEAGIPSLTQPGSARVLATSIYLVSVLQVVKVFWNNLNSL